MSKHEYGPFEALVAEVRNASIDRWQTVEKKFIDVVEAFDSEYAAGGRSSGWYQAKARYFNDIIVALISNASGKTFSMRCKRSSQLFDKIDIDICFPEEGDPVVAGEVKALGTPPHPGNEGTARPGARDLHKRVREVAFTSMDLKAAYAPPQPMGSFQAWVDSTSPGYFAFWAVRANDESDLESVRTTLSSLRNYCNGVAAVIYMPKSPESPTSYVVKKLADLANDKTIREMAQRVS